MCVVGSTNLDLVATAPTLPRPGETVMGRTYAEHPGGKGLNQAVAAARAGARTSFVSAVGDDAAGAMLLETMRAEGIVTDTVRRVAATPTGRALIGVADDGENSIIVVSGANTAVRIETVPDATVVLAQLEVPLGTVADAFRKARTAGARTVLNPAPAPTTPLPRELLALADIVIPNEQEVELLGGVRALLDAGVGAVVVTLGARGALLVTSEGEQRIDPFVVDAIDTTAAGDTFCGSFCARLADERPLVDALRWASAAAALSTTRAGAVPSIPSAGEVDELLRASQA